MLAILAGQGALPGLLSAVEPAHIVQFRGVEIDSVVPTLEARFEQLGALFDKLRELEVEEICLAGAMSRPPLDPVAFDPFTARQMPALMAAMSQGDDALLRAVIAVIEADGFRVVAAHEIRPDLIAPAGVLYGEQMGDADAARARAVLDALGPLDVGQGAVAAGGQVIGIETLQGTDSMLAFVASSAPGSGGVFVKRPKPGQDLRVDMPAIGPETIRAAAAAGLAGIEIAAGGVLMLDRDGIEAACTETGINLWAGP
ncbi:UDP-2,3-diacylglucosamine diphosphatase LpxI [Gymnodinialimonas sp. 2305UL16-5]|uniref:LpxI family protein n=1 Tax=Gymnodinialimonas mytili TaxID=3126503 RepID=UPI00309869CB